MFLRSSSCVVLTTLDRANEVSRGREPCTRAKPQADEMRAMLEKRDKDRAKKRDEDRR